MKNTIFTGCATALITPFNKDNTVNYKKLEEVIEKQISEGIDALVICGTTGESATLNNEEHIDVLKKAIQIANKRIPIIAGTGSNDTNYATELSLEAESLGADALLMVTPYYNKTSQDGLYAHFSHVANRVSLPIILYNVPSRTGVNIKPETYCKLSKIDNIVAAKEANGDISSVAKTISLCGDNLDVYSGNDDQIVPILSLGGKGVISVLSNIIPKQTHELCAAYFSGNTELATKMQLEYLELINLLFCDVNPIPVKAAMNILGYDVGHLRLPLVELSDDKKLLLTNEMRKLNLL